jgi:hypothetical protein
MKATEHTASPAPANDSQKPPKIVSEKRVLRDRAVLAYIRPDDGAQKFRYGPGMMDIVWLCGIDRHPTARVGWVGAVVYVNGRMRFEPVGTQP